MHKFKNLVFLILFLLALLNCSKPDSKTGIQIAEPEELYGQLFHDIQSAKIIFPDSKTFVDCIPRYNVNTILEHYSELTGKQDSATMAIFINNNFIIPGYDPSYKTDSSSVEEHIRNLWHVLKKPADKRISGTLIPLKYPYIIPGGRFREIYYWDSYFTMLGLQADNEIEIIQNMVDNFSYLIDSIGFIPNGNRTYYSGRSQPPFYAMMIQVLAESKGDTIYKTYLPFLEKEYSFWMSGSSKLTNENNTFRRVVLFPDGEILNRYWDDKNTPRPESYREDMETAAEAVAHQPNLKKEDVYRNLRAAAESGWDFSSRWLSPDKENNFRLSTIHTIDIIPVDLNSLIYNLELTLAKAYGIASNDVKSGTFLEKAETRKSAILKYCWNKESGFFIDYNFKLTRQKEILSLAGMYPLFFKIADKKHAVSTANIIQDAFLKAGGVVTTLNYTNQQWDWPNGWAPLQWMTIQGLNNYGHTELADEITRRWLHLNRNVYNRTYKMLEKYNVVDLFVESGGGEYPNQDGFGWTNGVYQKLSEKTEDN